jgi:hypothetical protein
MTSDQLISVQLFCNSHNVEVSFVQSLNESGLVRITEEEGAFFIDEENLRELEKLVHMHYELQINLEGIEAISHLLERIQELQQEIKILRNKIS